MRKLIKTVKAPCDGLLYPTEDGDQQPLRAGQWVEFKRKITPGNMRTMLGFSIQAEADNYAELAMGIDTLIDLLSHKIVAWNWTDLESADGAPLPPPSAEVLRELDFDDVLNLVNLYVDIAFPSKN